MNLPALNGNKIMVAPLDWGLGHATRCIPIVRALLDAEKKVVLGGSGSSGLLLKMTFPGLPFVELPAYNPRYTRYGNMYTAMLRQATGFMKTIRAEEEHLKQVIHDTGIDTVISDNRYGLRNKSIASIFITHQLFVRAGIFSRQVRKINHAFIQSFDQCWVPDFENEEQSLSGALSHGKHKLKNVRYIGPLSRFAKPTQLPEIKTDMMGIVSGPEPLRSSFEEKLRRKFLDSGKSCVLICGRPEQQPKTTSGNLVIYPHLDDENFVNLLCGARQIYCRPGYSTLMDLYTLGLLPRACFEATPGQTEQKYLEKRALQRY